MMERVTITIPVVGITRMQVCAIADATDEEILKVCNEKNPAGTRNGWVKVIREDYEQEEARPVVCERHSDRRHFLIIC